MATGDLQLNRFYDQTQDITRIDFVNDLMLVIGEVEMMVIKHSANRYLLHDLAWQYKKFYQSFGVLGIVPVDYQPLPA